jgi:hypothetical protein
VTATLSLDLPTEAGRQAEVRSFVAVVARSAGVAEELVGDLRIAVADLAAAAPSGPLVVRAEVQEHGLAIVVPAGPDRDTRAGMLSGLAVGIDTDLDEGTIRLTVPVEP